jgi:nicotinamidase-related amidase
MRDLRGLKDSALLVLDWQLFFVSPESPAFLEEAAIAEPNVRKLAMAFLAAGRPVFATRHGHSKKDRGAFHRFYGRLLLNDDPLAGLARFLKNRKEIRILEKDTYSAFASSLLSEDLRAAGVSMVVIAGCQTDKCVMANALAAFDLGFDVVVAADACAARSRNRHRQALGLLRRSCATVASTAEILRKLKP